MAKTKVAVTLSREIVEQLDALIAEHRFPNRSQTVEAALAEKLERLSLGMWVERLGLEDEWSRVQER